MKYFGGKNYPMYNLSELFDQIEKHRESMKQLVKDLGTATSGAFDARQRLTEVNSKLLAVSRAYEDKKAALLISGAIEGKNAETREANLRMNLSEELSELELCELAVKNIRLELDSNLSACEMLKALISAGAAEFSWLGGPGAFAMALEAEQKDTAPETTQFNRPSGVFVHTTERPADDDFFKSAEDPR